MIQASYNRPKKYLGAIRNNVTGDIVSVDNTAQQAVAQAKQCDWFHRTFHLKGCTPADKPVAAVDTTSGASSALDPNFTLDRLKLPGSLSNYVQPSIGAQVGLSNDEPPIDGSIDTSGDSVTKTGFWPIVIVLSILVILFVILYIRAKKQGK